MNAQHSHLVRRPHPGSALSTSSLQRQTSQPHCLSNEEIVVLLYFGYLGFQEEPLCEILKYKCGRVGALDSCLLTIDDLYEDEHLCNRDGNPDAGKIGAYFKRILPNKRKFMSLIRWDSEEETAMAAVSLPCLRLCAWAE